MDTVVSHLNFHSKHQEKCKFAVKLITLVINLFPLEVVQNANIVNFVYYGKTRVDEQTDQLFMS